MAIAFEHQSDNSPVIEIYYIEGLQFVKFHSIETEPIELMDFSSDSQDGPTCLLMYQDHFGKVFIFKVSKDKVTMENDENVDWASEGLLISNSCKNLSKYYSTDNMIVSLCKINGESLVVSDELGTVSLIDSDLPVPLRVDRLLPALLLPNELSDSSTTFS